MALRRSTAAEGLEDPRTELCPLVKYFAERKKIFNIHFRNVVGGHHKEKADKGDGDAPNKFDGDSGGDSGGDGGRGESGEEDGEGGYENEGDEDEDISDAEERGA